MSFYSSNEILNKNIRFYSNQFAVSEEILLVTKNYRSLHLKFESFTRNTGITEELFCLDGTVPITYNNVRYNIPINIFFPKNYPREGPIVFVRPTPDMNIKSSANVEPSGYVTIPYLKDWRSSDHTCMTMISILINVFGNSPPVFAKPKETPYPTSNGPFTGSALPYPNANPPYPIGGVGIPPYPMVAGQRTPYPASNTGLPYPTTGSSGVQAPYPTGNLPYPSSNSPYPNPSQPMNYMTNPSNLPYPGYDATIKPEYLQTSMKSALSDKMNRIKNEKYQQYQSEIQSLLQVQEDLKNGKVKLNAMMEEMKKEIENVESAKESLKGTIVKLEEIKTDIDKKSESPLDVDEMVTASFPLHKQLTNSFSEEQAIEDALYYLSDALGKNVIDIDTFLRKVRQYSRNQFKLRATVIACRRKANLDV